MCINMLPMYESQMQQDSTIVTSADDRGWTLLHHDAMAGNFGVVRLLVQNGADISARTPDGRDAATLAREMGWPEVADFLKAPTELG